MNRTLKTLPELIEMGIVRVKNGKFVTENGIILPETVIQVFGGTVTVSEIGGSHYTLPGITSLMFAEKCFVPEIAKTKLHTILVVYKSTHPTISQAEQMTHYAFNTTAVLKVGDKLTCPDYTTPMWVVAVLPVQFHKVQRESIGTSINVATLEVQSQISGGYKCKKA